MQALRITRPGLAEIADIDVPVPKEGEVAIDVAYVGYCGSDLTSYRGLNPLVSYPRVPGHEIAGTVAAVGSGADGLAVGQSVTVIPYFNCGQCKACRSGRPNACAFNETMGVQREGAMTGRVVVPAGKVLPVDGMQLRDLALIEPCAVGFHAVRRGAVVKGETVLVLGCGMIGLGIIMGALRAGATVIAADLSHSKLETARALGAAHVLEGGPGLAERVRALVPDGPDVVIEAVGTEATFLQAVDLVASTGRVVYVGYAKTPIAYDTKVFLTKELDIRGSRNAMPGDFEDVIEWLSTHPGAGNLVVSETVSLEDAPRALEAWHQAPGQFTKVLVRMTA